jgi:hypothetical protein
MSWALLISHLHQRIEFIAAECSNPLKQPPPSLLSPSSRLLLLGRLVSARSPITCLEQRVELVAAKGPNPLEQPAPVELEGLVPVRLGFE